MGDKHGRLAFAGGRQPKAAKHGLARDWRRMPFVGDAVVPAGNKKKPRRSGAIS